MYIIRQFFIMRCFSLCIEHSLMMVVAATEKSWNIVQFYKNFVRILHSKYCWNSF